MDGDHYYNACHGYTGIPIDRPDLETNVQALL